jgi:hypothetical protein
MDTLLSALILGLALLGTIAAVAGYESRDGFELRDR